MATIAQTAICIDLAKGLHYLSAQYDGRGIVEFDALTRDEKDRLIESAKEALESVKYSLNASRTVDYFAFTAHQTRQRFAVAKPTSVEAA